MLSIGTWRFGAFFWVGPELMTSWSETLRLQARKAAQTAPVSIFSWQQLIMKVREQKGLILIAQPLFGGEFLLAPAAFASPNCGLCSSRLKTIWPSSWIFLETHPAQSLPVVIISQTLSLVTSKVEGGCRCTGSCCERHIGRRMPRRTFNSIRYYTACRIDTLPVQSCDLRPLAPKIIFCSSSSSLKGLQFKLRRTEKQQLILLVSVCALNQMCQMSFFSFSTHGWDTLSPGTGKNI